MVIFRRNICVVVTSTCHSSIVHTQRRLQIYIYIVKLLFYSNIYNAGRRVVMTQRLVDILRKRYDKMASSIPWQQHADNRFSEMHRSNIRQNDIQQQKIVFLSCCLYIHATMMAICNLTFFFFASGYILVGCVCIYNIFKSLYYSTCVLAKFVIIYFDADDDWIL